MFLNIIVVVYNHYYSFLYTQIFVLKIKYSYLSHRIIDSFPRISKCKIKTSFVIPSGPKSWANKSDINFMIFILISVENCLKYDAIHDFSVRLRTDSNPADINRFQSHTRIFLIICYNYRIKITWKDEFEF